MTHDLIRFIREQYRTDAFIPLHAPVFDGNEKTYVGDTIDSTFVSSVGEYVNRFEDMVAQYTGSPRAVATVNGTAALHAALMLSGVRPGDLVIGQALTFIATCNAIRYCGADPVFVDVDRATLSMSPHALERWLTVHAERRANGECVHTGTGKRVAACVPMHTFGHPADLGGLLSVCERWGLPLIEDAAESLGSWYGERHTGTVGDIGALSFNGNKVITTGGGGMLLVRESLGDKAKHLTTTAKRPHPYEFFHDEVGYNYRLPNINAALGCAQMEQLPKFIAAKRMLAARYERFLDGSEFFFVREPKGCRSNYWLNAVLCRDRLQRDQLLQQTNQAGVMTRPVWTLMHRLPMFESCMRDELAESILLEERLVNLPSSVLPAESLA